MSTRRRYRITYDEAQIIILGLERSSESIKEVLKEDDSEYWKWILTRTNKLLYDLKHYQWFMEITK